MEDPRGFLKLAQFPGGQAEAVQSSHVRPGLEYSPEVTTGDLLHLRFGQVKGFLVQSLSLFPVTLSPGDISEVNISIGIGRIYLDALEEIAACFFFVSLVEQIQTLAESVFGLPP